MTTDIDPRVPGGFERRLLAALAVIDQQREPATPQVPVPFLAPHPRPGRPRLRRALSVVAVLTGLVALTTTAVATLHNPASFEAEGDAFAGDLYPVKGSGCREGATVVFTLDDRINLGATTALGEGTFSGEPRIPANTTPGSHDLAAECTDDHGERLVQHAELMVVTSVPLEAPGLWADSAVAGGETVVKGAGCKEGGEVVFTLDGTNVLGSTTAHRGGVFSAELTVPAESTLGTHDLTAVCSDHHGERLVQHADLVILEPEAGPRSAFDAIKKR